MPLSFDELNKLHVCLRRLATRLPPEPQASVRLVMDDTDTWCVLRSVQRGSHRWPQWLDLWLMVARNCGHDDGDVLLARLRDGQLVAALPDAFPARLRLAMQRSALMAAHAVGISGLPPHSGPATAAERLLHNALESDAAETAPLPDPGDEIELPVLLATNDEGRVAHLRLSCVPVAADNASPCSFIAAPGSQLLVTDKLFGDALTMAGRTIGKRLKPGPKPAVALVWDLLPPADQPLLRVEGDSAGAAFAIAGLALLRHDVQADLAQWLRTIDWRHAAITAALADDAGTLRKIGGLPKKLDAWVDTATRRLAPATVFVANDQPPGLHAGMLTKCGTLAELAEKLSTHTGELLSGEQQQLEALLLQPGEGRPDPTPTRKLLRQVAASGRSVQGLRGYLLSRYAEGATPDHGMLDLHFVNLELESDAPPDPGHADPGADRPGARQREPERFDSLRQMFEAHPDVAGWLITGMPGAGKTTLMRHHEMTRARLALQAVARGERPEELCLYVSLKDYPAATADPGRWLQDWWAGNHRQWESLTDLLTRHAGHVRLLFDAINEISLKGGGNRQDAVDGLVAWSRRHRDGLLPPVFSVRELERSVSVGDKSFIVRRASVQSWKPHQQREYCVARLPADGEALWGRLQADEPLRALCALPMNLDFQCTLYGETGEVALNRAELFSGLAWWRLRREFADRNLDAQGLLAAADHAVLAAHSDWWRTNLFSLPAGGTLVRLLDRQGMAQLQAHGGNARSVEWQAVAGLLRSAGLDDDAAEAWLHAVHDLGLASRSLGGDSFEFGHQLWGEFFAARRLALDAGGTVELPRDAVLDIGAQVPIEQALEAAEAARQPLATLQRAAWEETLKLALQLAPDPAPLLRRLMQADPTLAGRAAVGRLRKALDPALLDELRNRLHKLCIDPATDLRLRVEAGLALGDVGDRIRYEERNGCLIPNDEHLVPIEGGDTTMGSDDNDDEAYDDENPLTEVTVRPFRMAFAPVTNAEYRRFIDAGGYQSEELWGPDGSDSMKWFRETNRRQPYFWDYGNYNNPLQPVVGVCLWEAMAYCEWLSRQLGDGRIYRLPTEAEWEFAARGKQRHRYPWGDDEPTFDHCNHDATHLQRPSPVGVFPKGDRQVGGRGLTDLAGNVLEWTSSKFTDQLEHEALMIVTTHAKGNEVRRALRGGSWNLTARRLRAAFRLSAGPGNVGFDLGFRVVGVPI